MNADVQPISTHSQQSRLDSPWSKILELVRAEEFEQANEELHNIPDGIFDLDVDDVANVTAAHYAAMAESGAETLLLIVKKSGPACLTRAAGEEKATPLQLACQIMSGDTVDELVSSLGQAQMIDLAFRGVDIRENTALHYAAQNLHQEDCFLKLVDILRDRHDCLHQGNRDGMTPVMLAFDQQREQVLNKLVLQLEPTCFKDTDKNENTAVHYAALHHPSCLPELVKRLDPACLGWKNACTVTPLQLAMTSISPGAAKVTLELIELVDSKCILVANQFGDTVVHFAARDRAHADTLIRLVKKLGLVCLSTPNQQMRSPLHYACAAQKADIIEALAKHKGARKMFFSTVDRTGHTAIHYAARKEDQGGSKGTSNPPEVTLVKLIDVFGAECVCVKDDEGNTPLHIACGNLSPTAIKQVTGRLKKNLDWFTTGDENGTSAVHYAACSTSHSETLLTLAEIIGPECLSVVNKEGKSPLHLACANQSFETIQRLIDTMKRHLSSSSSIRSEESISGQKYINKADHNGNSAAHYAALNRKHADNLIKLTEKFQLSCLCDRNKEGKTPLHIAFCTHSAEIVAKLVKIAKNLTSPLKFVPKAQTEAGTDAEFAGSIEEDLCQECTNSAGNCLTCSDNDGNSVVHYAASCSSFSDILLDLCEHLGSEIMLCQNGLGVTPLHLAVQYSIYEPEQVSRLQAMFKNNFEKLLEIEDNSGRSVLFYACIGHNYNLLSSIDSTHKALRGTDASGNTLLHALFLAKWYMLSEAQAPRFLDAMSLLLRSGVDPLEENDQKQNCLHASELYGYSLRAVLTAAVSTDKVEIKSKLQSMLLNSESVHAVHLFFGRYHVSHFLEALSDLSGVDSQSLISLSVRKGNSKGATCLHYACEFGNQENIEYLLLHRQKLSSKTQSGQSCVDFAFDKDKLDRLLRAAKLVAEKQHGKHRAKKWMERIVRTILPLIDPPKLALKLPDENGAKQLIKSTSDQSIRYSIERGRAVGLVLHTALDSNNTDNSQRSDLLIFHRAVELDSAKIFRSMLRLDILTAKTEEDYATFLQMRKLAIKDKETEQNFETRFPQMQEFLKHWVHGGATSVLEVATFFEKTVILPDLIITRQLDLIPSCLIVLLHLKPKIASKRGKHEQLKELRRKLVSVVVNAFDQLFINANKEEQRLLFNYISGSFSVKVNKSETFGPKFPCRVAKNAIKEKDSYSRKMKVKELSVIQLVERLDIGDIYSTDCISTFAKQEWSTEQDGMRHFTATPNKKLIIHNVAFVVFLLYYAWYVTDFARTFANIVPDLIMLGYALSFTAQEVSDIYQRRRRKEFNIRPQFVVRLPVYFKDVLNVFDILALAFMWIGLVWKLCIHQVGWQGPTVHSCQMVLCTGFLLWGFRSISVLSYFEKIGPVTAMLKNLLLRDLFPFLAILLVIFYTFGVFYFNLLFPVAKASQTERDADNYAQKVLQEIFLLPASMLFGYFEELMFESSNGSNQAIGRVADPIGRSWFNGLLLFLFMLIVNIVLVNLLIALFNLTVSRMSGQALGIWRQTRFQMLREFQGISTLPPPISFVNYLVRACVRSRCQVLANARTGQEPEQPWYRNASAYPPEYVDFLKFQAVQLRQARPGKLQQEVGKNRGEIDALKAHTENTLYSVHRELDEAVLDLDGRLVRLESMAVRQRQRMRQINRKLDQLLESVGSTAAVKTN